MFAKLSPSLASRRRRLAAAMPGVPCPREVAFAASRRGGVRRGLRRAAIVQMAVSLSLRLIKYHHIDSFYHESAGLRVRRQTGGKSC